jgi:hypothetical protein
VDIRALGANNRRNVEGDQGPHKNVEPMMKNDSGSSAQLNI